MKVGIVQMDCEVGNLARNSRIMRDHVTRAAGSGCDLVVFPEMSDVGYLMDVIVDKAPIWEGESSPLAELQRAAATHGISVVAGLSERDEGAVYNAIASIDTSGRLITKYRKTHLVTVEPMFEHRYLGRGEELVVGSVAGLRAGFMTCYELRFPEVARSLMLAGADVIILPAAFPLVRLGHWEALIRARAIENQLFVIAANRVGSDGPGLTFCGSSRVIDPYGTVLSSASEIEEKLLLTDIDPQKVTETREHMQVIRDRRPDLYERTVKRDLARS